MADILVVVMKGLVLFYFAFAKNNCLSLTAAEAKDIRGIPSEVRSVNRNLKKFEERIGCAKHRLN